jgi:hypothetical protein
MFKFPRNEGVNMPQRTNNRYSKEFRIEAAKLVVEGGVRKVFNGRHSF